MLPFEDYPSRTSIVLRTIMGIAGVLLLFTIGFRFEYWAGHKITAFFIAMVGILMFSMAVTPQLGVCVLSLVISLATNPLRLLAILLIILGIYLGDENSLIIFSAIGIMLFIWSPKTKKSYIITSLISLLVGGLIIWFIWLMKS